MRSGYVGVVGELEASGPQFGPRPSVVCLLVRLGLACSVEEAGRRLGFVGAEHGRAESLNLAAAATVCLYASATAQGR